MEGWKNSSTIVKAIAVRARQVAFRGESPNEQWSGDVEVICDQEGNLCLHVTRAHKKKFGGKRWHSESVYVTLSPEAWDHLKSAPVSIVSERK